MVGASPSFSLRCCRGNLRKAEAVDPKVLVSSGSGLVCFSHPCGCCRGNLRKAEAVDPKVLVSSGSGLVCFSHPCGCCDVVVGTSFLDFCVLVLLPC